MQPPCSRLHQTEDDTFTIIFEILSNGRSFIPNFFFANYRFHDICHVTYHLVKNLKTLSSMANCLKSYLICRMKLLQFARLIPVYFLCCKAAIPTLHTVKHFIDHKSSCSESKYISTRMTTFIKMKFNKQMIKRILTI